MKSTAILALCAPLLASCKPMAHERLHHHHLHERDDGGVITSTSTVWEEVTITIDVTVTVFVAPPVNGHAKAADVNLNAPKPNPAVATPKAAPVPAVNAVVQKPAMPPPQALPTPAPAPPAPVVQHQVQQAPAPAPQPPVVQQPPQQQPAPQQPAPQPQSQPQQQQPQKQVDSQQGSTGSTGVSAPSGGACGDVGGKCMASDVTIYNDQGTGACGWANDTNSQDYFALAQGQWDGFTNDAPGPHKNKWCGRMATISINGKQVSGMLTDKCPGCAGWSIDLSQSLWNKAYPGEAPTRKYNVEWWFTGPQIYNGPN